MNKDKQIIVGKWGDDIQWELYATSTPPPAGLCTAVMCVAISDNKVILACSERGWGLLGGHIEDGETMSTALRRETLEEGGFTIDQHQLFAVCKITAAKPEPSGRRGKVYPFPVSYMTYYWATTKQPLLPPTGEEIIESKAFGIKEISTLNTPDQAVIEAGWQAFERARKVSL